MSTPQTTQPTVNVPAFHAVLDYLSNTVAAVRRPFSLEYDTHEHYRLAANALVGGEARDTRVYAWLHGEHGRYSVAAEIFNDFAAPVQQELVDMIQELISEMNREIIAASGNMDPDDMADLFERLSALRNDVGDYFVEVVGAVLLGGVDAKLRE